MLKQILQKYVDQPVKMVVYNSKYRTTRGQSEHQRHSTSALLSCDLCGYHDLYTDIVACVTLRIFFPQM